MSELRLETRPRTSSEQFAALLAFMESRGDIARPQQGAQGRIKSDCMWEELAELLNSIGGGVKRSTNKWKKVWADWKAKTKKKALAIRREDSGTGGGFSSKHTLTAPEQRVLGIMGLIAVVGQDEIEERGFYEVPTQRTPIPPPIRDSIGEFPTQISGSVTDEIKVEFPPYYSEASASPSSSEVAHYPPPPLDPVPTQMPSAVSPTTTSRKVPQPLRPATPRPLASPAAATRRRMLYRARTRRTTTPFERATHEFVAVENRRLQLEEERERNNHQREMERLRLESRRIDMEENQNQTLSRLVGVLNRLTETLSQLRPLSLPSTDTL